METFTTLEIWRMA